MWIQYLTNRILIITEMEGTIGSSWEKQNWVKKLRKCGWVWLLTILCHLRWVMVKRHPLSWRSARIDEVMSKIDDFIVKHKFTQARRQMKPRKFGVVWATQTTWCTSMGNLFRWKLKKVVLNRLMYSWSVLTHLVTKVGLSLVKFKI